MGSFRVETPFYRRTYAVSTDFQTKALPAGAVGHHALVHLDDYLRKRDPAGTPEPFGGEPGETARFVVQRHAARRLHYDFRLERGGALASWAVPKGVPLRAGERHLAVQVEDHPLDYADFEGEIPAGQYGAGTVEIWDRGTYELVEEKKDGASPSGCTASASTAPGRSFLPHSTGIRATGSSC